MSAATTEWTGWDRRAGSAGASPAELASTGAALYELLALAGRGFRPPGYLTVADAPPEGAAEMAALSFRRVWSVRYRTIAETAPATTTPFGIYLLGVNPPEDASDDDLAVFNDFYTNVHLVEVAERRRALRAARFELERDVVAPAKGAPRYLAVYEVDEAGAAQRRHVGPPYSKGPDVWQRHSTPWRIWFARLASPAG
jgi:hypothetical protein